MPRLSELWRVFVNKIEDIVIVTLTLLMGLIVLLATAELGLIIAADVLSPPLAILQTDKLLEIFGFFLIVLIGIELMDTIKVYLEDRVIRVEVVLLVGIIAVARKIIILEPGATPGATLVGIGVLLLALAGGYFLIRRAHRDQPRRGA